MAGTAPESGTAGRLGGGYPGPPRFAGGWAAAALGALPGSAVRARAAVVESPGSAAAGGLSSQQPNPVSWAGPAGGAERSRGSTVRQLPKKYSVYKNTLVQR